MRNRQCEFVHTNVRPSNYKSHREGGDNNCGDCTTRAMTYCLKGSMTYEEIEAEQYRIAERQGCVRNATGVWDKVMTTRGFSWVQLNDLKSRANVANWLSSVESPMVTISRTHACAVEKGKIYDTWDSRGGRVFGVLVKNEEVKKVANILLSHNIDCELVDVPKHQVNHRRRRYSNWW